MSDKTISDSERLDTIARHMDAFFKRDEIIWAIGYAQRLELEIKKLKMDKEVLLSGCHLALSALDHAADTNEHRPPPQGETYTGTRLVLRDCLKR